MRRRVAGVGYRGVSKALRIFNFLISLFFNFFYGLLRLLFTNINKFAEQRQGEKSFGVLDCTSKYKSIIFFHSLLLQVHTMCLRGREKVALQITEDKIDRRKRKERLLTCTGQGFPGNVKSGNPAEHALGAVRATPH